VAKGFLHPNHAIAGLRWRDWSQGGGCAKSVHHHPIFKVRQPFTVAKSEVDMRANGRSGCHHTFFNLRQIHPFPLPEKYPL
jgi:hypothetical protein